MAPVATQSMHMEVLVRPEALRAESLRWTHPKQRLVAMVEGVPDLTIDQLNEATQAWVECEYLKTASRYIDRRRANARALSALER